MTVFPEGLSVSREAGSLSGSPSSTEEAVEGLPAGQLVDIPSNVAEGGARWRHQDL